MLRVTVAVARSVTSVHAELSLSYRRVLAGFLMCSELSLCSVRVLAQFSLDAIDTNWRSQTISPPNRFGPRQIHTLS